MGAKEKHKESFMEKFERVVTPFGQWMANQKHFSSITAGMMSCVGLTLLAAIFQIIANPPVTQDMVDKHTVLKVIFGGWLKFATANKEAILLPYNMSIGMLGVISALAIAYHLAKKYEMNPLTNGVVSMVIFLLVSAPVTTYKLADDSTVTALSNSFMGGQGLFTSILVALVTVEIAHFCEKHHIEIKMPESVPPFLSASFSAVIPLIFDTIIFYGGTLILKQFDLTIPTAINKLVSIPLSVVNTAPGVLFIICFGALLWCCGIHGTAIIYPFILPVLLEAVTKNAQLVAAGQSPEINPIFIFSAVAMVGGSGNTLGMVILSAWKAKSEQLKAIGKIGLIPGIFNINEPVLFGMPIMYNPILMIPYVLGTLLIGILVWVAMNLGLYAPECVFVGAAMPIGVSGMLASMSMKNFFFQILMVPVMILVWYPFFKAYDDQLLKQEQKQMEEVEQNKEEK